MFWVSIVVKLFPSTRGGFNAFKSTGRHNAGQRKEVVLPPGLYYYYYIKSSQFSIIYHRKLQSTSISSSALVSFVVGSSLASFCSVLFSLVSFPPSVHSRCQMSASKLNWTELNWTELSQTKQLERDRDEMRSERKELAAIRLDRLANCLCARVCHLKCRLQPTTSAAEKRQRNSRHWKLYRFSSAGSFLVVLLSI